MSAIWAGTPSLRRKTCSATCANEFWSFFKRKATEIWFPEEISRLWDKKTGIAGTSNWFGQNQTDLDQICQIPGSRPQIPSRMTGSLLPPSARESRVRQTVGNWFTGRMYFVKNVYCVHLVDNSRRVSFSLSPRVAVQRNRPARNLLWDLLPVSNRIFSEIGFGDMTINLMIPLSLSLWVILW